MFVIIIINDLFCRGFMFIFNCNYKRSYTPGFNVSPSVVMVRDNCKVRMAAISILQFNMEFTDKGCKFFRNIHHRLK